MHIKLVESSLRVSAALIPGRGLRGTRDRWGAHARGAWGPPKQHSDVLGLNRSGPCNKSSIWGSHSCIHIRQHLPARVLICRQCAGIPCADMFRYACACTLNAQNAEFAEYMHAVLNICMRLKRCLGCRAWQELEEEISRARDQSVTVRMLEQQLHQQQQNFQQQLEAAVAKGEQMAQLKRVGTRGTSSSNVGAKSSSGVKPQQQEQQQWLQQLRLR